MARKKREHMGLGRDRPPAAQGEVALAAQQPSPQRAATPPAARARTLVRRAGEQRARGMMAAAEPGIAGAGAATLPVILPGDAYEREAERTADAVMSGPEGVHREEDGGGGWVPGFAPPVVHDVLASPGRPLEGETRAFMEGGFGVGFGGVRVHTDQRAAESAASVDAHAYTVGSNVVFAAERYAPGTREGDRLIAHELTHVVQQGAALPSMGPSGPALRPRAFSPAVIQRQEKPDAGASTPAALPSADELTTRIARCIGIWETARGKDQPAPTESKLDTVAGVHASMATIEQATMPYAITALKRRQFLRDQATPPLTMTELNAAEARMIAVDQLLDLVAAAAQKGEAPDAFIIPNTAAITATGLSNDDVRTMFGAVTLRSTLDTALVDMGVAEKAARETGAAEKKSGKQTAAAGKTARQSALKAAIDAIPSADRLGLGEASLKTYIKEPKKWGENLAGWQRKAVAGMENDVAARIEAVAVSESGTALAIPVIRSRVDVELAKTPVPSAENIVKTVAQKNNSNETGYGQHVWETYQRLYP